MLYTFSKRLMDIIGSIVGLVIFCPILLLTAIYIKIVSPKGPVFADIPDRVGREGSEFRMYKFRTMIPNAHEWMKTQPELYKEYLASNYKLENDPRWLPGAKMIRKYSIDEMPQFINILFGQMSLVGPRPYYPDELAKYIKDDPRVEKFVKQALTTKPGITGPWQVGGRSEVNFIDRIKKDAQYAKKRSLLYDIKVLVKTPLAVLSAKGAY